MNRRPSHDPALADSHRPRTPTEGRPSRRRGSSARSSLTLGLSVIVIILAWHSAADVRDETARLLDDLRGEQQRVRTLQEWNGALAARSEELQRDLAIASEEQDRLQAALDEILVTHEIPKPATGVAPAVAVRPVSNAGAVDDPERRSPPAIRGRRAERQEAVDSPPPPPTTGEAASLAPRPATPTAAPLEVDIVNHAARYFSLQKCEIRPPGVHCELVARQPLLSGVFRFDTYDGRGERLAAAGLHHPDLLPGHSSDATIVVPMSSGHAEVVIAEPSPRILVPAAMPASLPKLAAN